MIDLEKRYLDDIKLILRTFAPDCEVRAFGSRISGEAHKFSDLDLVIKGKEELELMTLAKLKDAFAESNLPIRVDVLDWNSISDKMREKIDKQFDIIQTGD